MPIICRSPRWSTPSWLAVLILVSSVLSSVAASGQESKSFKIPVKSGQDRQISYYVSRGLEESHLLQRELDDEISQRAMKNFLKRLDARKYYFLQSDLEDFEKYRTTLDDLIRERDVSVGKEIFRRYIQRIDERVRDIDELLDGEFDFTLDEQVPAAGKEETYAADAAAARDRWRRRLKHELLTIQVSQENARREAEEQKKKEDEEAKQEEAQQQDSPDKEDPSDEQSDEQEPESEADANAAEMDMMRQNPREILRRRYKNFQRRMRQTDSDEVLEFYLTAITTSYDPHSTYFSPSSLEDFRIRMGLNYQGIGAEIADEDGDAIIQRVMPNGGADKGGELKEGDQIVSVGQGEEGEMVDAANMKLQDIIEMIRGPEGTTVRLGVIPKGHSDIHIYKIVRTRIELGDNAAKSKIMEVGEDDAKKKVGIIDLPSFYLDMEAMRRQDPDARSTSRDMRRLLEEFKSQDVDAVVVDLRRNGGGSLSEAVAATGLFIRSGPVVQVKDTVNGVVRHSDRDPSIVWDGPLVVLTSRFSASASEIFAGALKDYGRAVVVGDSSTHGKGTVQSLQEIGPIVFKVDDPLNLGALKITIQQFYRPSGVSTQNRGVVSDVVLPSFSEHFAEGEASLDYAVPFDEIPPTSYNKRDDIDEALLDELKSRSAKRVEASDEFASVLRRATSFKDLQDRKMLPLKKEKFLALQKQMDDERAEQRRLMTPGGLQRDYYLDEVLAITGDLVDLLK